MVLLKLPVKSGTIKSVAYVQNPFFAVNLLIKSNNIQIELVVVIA